MKKKSRWKKIVIIIAIFIIGIVSFILWFERHQEVMGVNYVVEDFIKDNFEGIEHVEINEQDHPLILPDVFIITGYVNNDKDMSFDLEVENKKYLGPILSVNTSENFPEMKEECKVEFCQ
ncbi:hypothetical protein AB4Y30_02165 [Ornithinibacillus sp. 4-3]|uniref:DUF1433 domain-containing protein n=1 Tax=Ornithinibacillus sp. 4-3 TaxID=3231488 RepID=A0AB39HRL6_9BACI